MYGQYYQSQPRLALSVPPGQAYRPPFHPYQYQNQHAQAHYAQAPHSYFPPQFPVHPPPLPMDPANPRFNSRGTPHRKVTKSPLPPPKAKLGGPTGRPYTPSPAESSPKGEWRGRQINVKIPIEPYQTTWDLKKQEWMTLMDASDPRMGPERVPLPLSPMEKGSSWPCRNEVVLEPKQLVNGVSSETLETVDSAEIDDVTRFGMVNGGRLKVTIPDNTGWLKLIHDAADRLSSDQLQADRQVFGEGEPLDDAFSLPPAPRLKAVRSLSDRTLLHPSPARPKFAFRQLTDYVRRLSFDDSPAPSPLVLPGARQLVKETPTKQLFKTAIGQLGDTKPIPTSSLSVAAVPFIPKEPNKVETSSPSPPQQPTLSVSAAAYLPPWVEAPVSPEERVYPSVRRYEPSLASHVATSVMRPRAGTVAFGSPRENMNPTRGHGNHFQSLDSLQWFAPVESGPGADEFEYDMDSRSASEFSNPSDEDEYLRRRLASRLRPSLQQRQWSSSSPCQSVESADSFGVQRRTKRRTERDEDSPVSDEANERGKARAKPQVRPGRSKQARMPTSPAATGTHHSTSDSTSLNPNAKPFLFGGPQPFTFRSPLPPQKLTTSDAVTRPTVDTSRQMHTPTETFVTADGSPLRKARALQVDSGDDLGTVVAGVEQSLRHPHTLAEETQEEATSTLVNSVAEHTNNSIQSRPETPCSAQFALEPAATSGQSSPVPDWTPEKNGIDKELQQDIMRKWRFPVSPDTVSAPSITQTLAKGDALPTEPMSPTPSSIGRRTRRPIPSFDAPSAEAAKSLHVPTQELWPGGDGITSTHTSVEFPMRLPPSSLAVRNTSPPPPSENGTIASCSEVSQGLLVGDHAEGGPQKGEQAMQSDDLKVMIADCIQTSFVETLDKFGTASSPLRAQRIEQFMERIADVLEQQSQLLLGATQDQPLTQDDYPDIKTHTEELLSALVAGQHTLLDRVGTMHDLRELLDGAPAAISRAAETLDTAHESLLNQSALQAELQTARQRHLDAKSEAEHQLAKARAAHGQARSELEMSQEQFRTMKAERDELRQQLGEISADNKALQHARFQAEESARAASAARTAEEQVLMDLRSELADVRRQLNDRQANLQRLREEVQAKDATAEGMATTIMSLADQLSKHAEHSATFEVKASKALEAIEFSAREHLASGAASSTVEVSDLCSKLRDAEIELSTLRGEQAVLKDLYAEVRTASESRASEPRDQLCAAQASSRQTQELLQVALLEQAKSEGKIEACMARETALRQQYTALHRWASDCRRALERSEALRCQPFIIHDVHTGDYAEVVTPLNRRESVLPMALSSPMEPSRTQESTASSDAPLTPPRHGKHAPLAASTSIMTPPPTVASKNRKASVDDAAAEAGQAAHQDAGQ